MLSFNPYEVLGIGEDATPAEIKRAYRRLVKKTHPDSGGSTEEFRRVNEAYLILSDPEKRDYYDKTGDVKDDGPDRSVEIIVELFNTMLEQDIPLHVDYIQLLKETLKETIKKLKDRVMHNEDKQKRFEAMTIRFKTKKKAKDNIFLSILKGKIANLQLDTERMLKSIIESERALEVLDSYIFLADKAPEVEPTFFRVRFND